MSSANAFATFPPISSPTRPTIPLSLGSRILPSPTDEPSNPNVAVAPITSLPTSASCTLQHASDPLSIASLVLGFGGLLLCLTFLWATVQQTRAHRSANLESTAQQAKESPRRSYSDPMQGAQEVAARHRQPTAGNRPPFHHPSKLHSLVVIAWTLFTLDQIAMLLYFLSLYFVCPQYSCRDKTLAITPGCPAPKFLVVALYLQVIGAAVFVCASITRFLRLYSVLSRTRYILLRLAYGVVAVVLAIRLVSLTAHEYVRLDQAKWPIGSRVERQMHTWNVLTYTVSYLILGVLDLVALVQGLIYIGRVRRGIRAMVMTLPRRLSAASDAMRRGSTATTTGLQVGSRSWTWPFVMDAGVNTSPDDMDTTLMERQARLVMIWIAAGICLLITFAGVMSVLPAMLKEVPLLLYNSLMTLLLKLFAAFVSLAIIGAGRVIAGV